MEETLIQPELLSVAKKNIKAYLETHDVQYVAEDAVFTHMSTGEEYKGREAIAGMLHYMYHIAFDATAEIKNYIITEDKAMFEGIFNGKHIGEFAGIAPTQKNVSVPVCVCYDLKEGLIEKGRVYMLTDVLMAQLQK